MSDHEKPLEGGPDHGRAPSPNTANEFSDRTFGPFADEARLSLVAIDGYLHVSVILGEEVLPDPDGDGVYRGRGRDGVVLSLEDARRIGEFARAASEAATLIARRGR